MDRRGRTVRRDTSTGVAAALRSDDRGQTHIDFVVGIVLFLVAFTFVAAAVPHLLSPYEDQSTPVVADRVSASLAESLLVGANDPGVLDPACVEEYFGGNTTCDTFDPAADLPERSGVASHYSINVRLTGDVDGDGTVAEGERLEVGPPVPSGNRAASMDRQLLLLHGEPATLEVWVW